MASSRIIAGRLILACVTAACASAAAAVSARGQSRTADIAVAASRDVLVQEHLHPVRPVKWRSDLLRRLSPGSTPGIGLREPANPAQSRDRGPRPIHDFAGTMVDLGRDFWMTLTAPARMNGREWWTVAGVTAVGGALYLVDDDLTRMALRNREEPVLDEVGDLGTFVEPIGLMGNTNVWYATGAVASWAIGMDRSKRLFTELLYSHWIAGLIRGGTNRLVGRSRPHDGRGARHFAVGGGTSFPSGHASTLLQVAAVLSHHADRLPVTVLAYSLAGAGAWERINAEQHWASDVWLGAAYGWAVAKLVIRLHEEEALRAEPLLTPTGEPGVLLRYRF